MRGDDLTPTPNGDELVRPGELRIRPLNVALAVLVLVAAYAAYRGYWVARLNAAIHAIQESGYPATTEQLEAWLPNPVGANAAPIVTRAGVAARLDGSSGWWPLFQGRSWPRSVSAMQAIEPLDAYLDRNRHALSLYYEAARVGDARFETSAVGLPTEGRPAHVAHAVLGANLLAMEAVSHAFHNRSSEAASALIASFAIGNTLQNEPSMVGQQVRLAALQQTIAALEWVLPLTDLDADTARALNDTLLHLEDSKPLTRAYAAARCLGAWYYALPFERQLVILGTNGTYPSLQHAYYRYGGKVEQDLLCFFGMMNQFVALTDLPPEERFAAFQTVSEQSLRIPSQFRGSSIYFQSMPHIVTETTDLIARARAARVLIALDRYAAANSVMPDALAELAPAYLEPIPRDPFGNGELRYVRSEDAVRVFSTGPDPIDDGNLGWSYAQLGDAIRQWHVGPRTTYDLRGDPGLHLEYRP